MFSLAEPFIEELLYDHLIPILRKNIKMQLDSGAEIVYVFDTNSKQLDKDYFEEKYLKMVEKALFQPFPKKIAYFSKNKSFYDLNKMERIPMNLQEQFFQWKKVFVHILVKVKQVLYKVTFHPSHY